MGTGCEEFHERMKQEGISLIDRIKSDTELVILDAMGTYVPTAAERTGFKDFLRYCKKNNIRVVVASDSSGEHLKGLPETRLLRHYVSSVYTRNSGRFIDLPEKPEDRFAAGLTIKDLNYLLNQFKNKYNLKIDPKKVVVIGDSGTDGLAAKLANAEFIHVSTFDPFDFKSILPENQGDKNSKGGQYSAAPQSLEYNLAPSQRDN
ncbi:MAG: HAD family hydrolase [Nanoarchaeota archaeon]|nr:HAD family hydrolase [Nanoarchaeota archaeon]